MKRNVITWSAVAALAVIWGYNWIVVKIATHDASPFLLTALRTTGGSVALFATLALLRRPLNPPPLVPTIIFGILQTSVFSVFQTLAVASGGAGKAVVLAYTMPFWVVFLAWPLLGERLSRAGTAGIVLAAIGLGFVLYPIDPAHGLTGAIFAVLAAIGWAIGTVYAKWMRGHYRTELLSLTAWQLLFGSIPLVIAALVVPHQHVRFTTSFIIAFAYMVIPATALAWLLFLFVLSRLSASATGISSLLTPVVGVVAAWLQLGETPSTSELTGIVFILGALVCNAWPNQAAARSAPDDAARRAPA